LEAVDRLVDTRRIALRLHGQERWHLRRVEVEAAVVDDGTAQAGLVAERRTKEPFGGARREAERAQPAGVDPETTRVRAHIRDGGAHVAL
jgi:hypothetical protein